MIEAWLMASALAFVILFATLPWWAVVGGIYVVSWIAVPAIWAVER